MNLILKTNAGSRSSLTKPLALFDPVVDQMLTFRLLRRAEQRKNQPHGRLRFLSMIRFFLFAIICGRLGNRSFSFRRLSRFFVLPLFCPIVLGCLIAAARR